MAMPSTYDLSEDHIRCAYQRFKSCAGYPWSNHAIMVRFISFPGCFVILLRRFVFTVLAVLGIVLFYLWFVLLSPFGYEAPEDLSPIAQGEHQVFVYGTLRYGLIRWLVYDRWGDPKEVTLSGFRRDELDLKKAPTAQVKGYLLEVDATELKKLDRYERLGIRYYRDRIILDNGTSAWVYRRL
ncbi:gamma-glutamylcyclotransferase family protein [Halomonas sp. GXIMD04776]|uniref:gamma-glutamylcyclotransferase family protein n=1 Tax=Halomonas sp. GXIMD04776 TaxID=3415605 RepID=UPI003C8836FE